MAKKEAVKTEVKNDLVKCQYCGKLVTRAQARESEAGGLCKHIHEELGMTAADLAEHRRSMSATEVPEGYIKVSVLHKICERKEVPVARMVKAIGGDRGLQEPIDPRFRPVYVGNCRYVDAFCGTPEGLAIIMGEKPARGSAKAGTTVTAKSEISAMTDALIEASD